MIIEMEMEAKLIVESLLWVKHFSTFNENKRIHALFNSFD